MSYGIKRICRECGFYKFSRWRGLCVACYKYAQDNGLLEFYPTEQEIIIAKARARDENRRLFIKIHGSK